MTRSKLDRRSLRVMATWGITTNSPRRSKKSSKRMRKPDGWSSLSEALAITAGTFWRGASGCGRLAHGMQYCRAGPTPHALFRNGGLCQPRHFDIEHTNPR